MKNALAWLWLIAIWPLPDGASRADLPRWSGAAAGRPRRRRAASLAAVAAVYVATGAAARPVVAPSLVQPVGVPSPSPSPVPSPSAVRTSPVVSAAAAAQTAPPIVVQTLAAAGAPTGLPDGVEQRVRQLALDGTRSLVVPVGGVQRIEVVVGALDARLRLAPCRRIELHLPVGSRLWGATRVGLRCVEGASHWNVFVPVTVKVQGRALVAAAALPAGSVLTAADLVMADVDLADDASPALLDAPLAVGRTLQRALHGGQSLRLSHLKPRQWFAAGDTVRVQAGGDGFTVSGEAVALTRGIEGEAARVRTETGRVLTGMPVAERRIGLPL